MIQTFYKGAFTVHKDSCPDTQHSNTFHIFFALPKLQNFVSVSHILELNRVQNFLSCLTVIVNVLMKG